MKKRIIALILTLALVTGLFAGCTKPMDAQTLVQNMEEATKSATAMSGKMAMDMDLTLAVTGMTMDMGFSAEVDMKSDMAAAKSYMDVSMDIKAFGITQTQNMVVYTAPEGDQILSYTYSEQDDSWTRAFAEFPDLQELNTSATLTDLPAEKLVLAEEKELIGEKEYYVLTVTMDGEYIQQLMDASMATVMTQMGDTLTGEDVDQIADLLENMDWSAMSMVMVYHVDPETFLPVQYSIEVTGLGAALNSMVSELMAQLTAEMGGGEIELTVDVPLCKIVMTELSYTDVQVPAVPQEGIDAAALNPLQLDGSFVLRSGEEAVRIVLPEAYTGYAEDPQSLIAFDEAYSVTALYSLVPDATVEQIQANFEEEITFAQEYEYYDSHSYGEFSGFTTLILNGNDGSTAYYCWKQLEGGVILTVEINTAASEVTPDVLLDCIEEYEG